MFDQPDSDDVLIVGGCPAGVDFEIIHHKTSNQIDKE